MHMSLHLHFFCDFCEFSKLSGFLPDPSICTIIGYVSVSVYVTICYTVLETNTWQP